jgi:hypothetical protein
MPGGILCPTCHPHNRFFHVCNFSPILNSKYLFWNWFLDKIEPMLSFDGHVRGGSNKKSQIRPKKKKKTAIRLDVS